MKEIMLILKIMQIGLMINSREKNTVFINYYGHVNLLRIGVHKEGWNNNEKESYSKEIYLERENIETELKSVIKDLRELGMEDDEEYVPKDEDEFNIFELIAEEKDLDEAWEAESNG